jgi:hypothetical protein
MSKLQAQANCTARQLSATIANLMGEFAALRNLLSSKEHVEKEPVEAHSKVDFLQKVRQSRTAMLGGSSRYVSDN